MARFLSLILVWAFVGQQAQAQARDGCPELVTTAVLARQISQADVAFSQMDESEFRNARWGAQRAVNCLGEPIQVGQAAAYYRMEALGSFLDVDHARAVSFFRSMLQVAPHYVLPEGLAADGHPLRVNFEVARGSIGMPGKEVRRAQTGIIRVDGEQATHFPVDRPYLFQHIDDEGRVLASTVVGHGAEPPSYAQGRGVQKKSDAPWSPKPEVHKRSPLNRFNVNVPLASIAGVAAAVSGVTYAMAVHHETRFWDPTTSKQELPVLRKRTNNMVYVSGTAAAVALTAGVGAVVVGHF